MTLCIHCCYAFCDCSVIAGFLNLTTLFYLMFCQWHIMFPLSRPLTPDCSCILMISSLFHSGARDANRERMETLEMEKENLQRALQGFKTLSSND